MKAIMVMFDSLNRRMLPPYSNFPGSYDWVHAPNFQRLATRTATFDNSYIGSMPCMPARRELHTARLNFLHRSWGPIEPYDDSIPEILKRKGIHTSLITDHQHYWEDGGATYHNRYSSYQFIRGQEGDLWMGQAQSEPALPNARLSNALNDNWHSQDRINRKFIEEESDYPQAKTFAAGMDFIERNKNQDNWFLQLETFDPHEPFMVPEKYKKLYNYDFSKYECDWPPYERVSDSDKELVEHIRFQQAALVSMCDAYLGKILDQMDQLDLWKDTLLIVNTDHGYLLGEHDWWAKIVMPFYNEIANTPLFIWDPNSQAQNVRRKSMVQTIDLGPTLLKHFNIEPTKDMQGKALQKTIAQDEPIRETALFGLFGAHVNVTDGKYLYMRACVTHENTPLFEYTLMPTHMRQFFQPSEFAGMKLHPGFSFTKNIPLLQIPTRRAKPNPTHFGNLLFDLEKDPLQLHPLQNEHLENEMIQILKKAMQDNEAPAEQFLRLGI